MLVRCRKAPPPPPTRLPRPIGDEDAPLQIKDRFCSSAESFSRSSVSHDEALPALTGTIVCSDDDSQMTYCYCEVVSLLCGLCSTYPPESGNETIRQRLLPPSVLKGPHRLVALKRGASQFVSAAGSSSSWIMVIVVLDLLPSSGEMLGCIHQHQ